MFTLLVLENISKTKPLKGEILFWSIKPKDEEDTGQKTKKLIEIFEQIDTIVWVFSREKK